MKYIGNTFSQTFDGLLFSYLTITVVTWYVHHKFPVSFLLYIATKKLKVPITPKYFFRLNNSLHLFETHCTFLHLFSPNLDFLQAVKVTKSDHHLLHDRASKGYGSIPGLMSQTYLHACLQRLDVNPGIDPYPLQARSCNRWWLDFVTFTSYKEVKI